MRRSEGGKVGESSWQRVVRKWRNNDERRGGEELTPPPSVIKIMVGTWNVGGKCPGSEDGLNLKEWLGCGTEADIYVLGFQEIVGLKAGNVIGPEDDGPAGAWVGLIEGELNKLGAFKVVGMKQMVGIFLCVWARHNLCVSKVAGSCVGRGIMGVLGNKGCVSISITVAHTTLCFVCAHLSSGHKPRHHRRRNRDVSHILKRTSFSHPAPCKILDHHNVILLGDLNYRVASADRHTNQLVANHQWQALLVQDELRIEQTCGGVFEGWEEGTIRFAPTYKYAANSDHYLYSNNNSKKERTPSWCDRILWKGHGVKQEFYGRAESKFSDHRPVLSVFHLQSNSSSTFVNSHNNHSCLAKVQPETLLNTFHSHLL